MESRIFENGQEKDPSAGELLEEGSISSEEEGFMKGYSEDEEIATCEECGTALREEKVIKEIDGEKHQFCSEECANDFIESLG